MSDDPSSIGIWILAAGLIGNTLLTWVKLTGRAESRTITPTPLPVRPDLPGHDKWAAKDHLHPDYMLRSECPVRHGDDERRMREQTVEIKASLAHMAAALEAHNAKAEARAGKLHDRIDPIATRLGEVNRLVDAHLEDHRRGTH